MASRCDIITIVKPLITYSDFEKLDIRIGKIISAENVSGSSKLYLFRVDFGEEGEKTVLSGISQYFTVDSLVGKCFPFVINMAPKIMKVGENTYESEGMIIATDNAERPVLLIPDGEVEAGAVVH